MDELQVKIARLPAWARQYIKHLETSREPLIDVAAAERRKADKEKRIADRLRDQLQAMEQLLTFAHKGGHPDAGEYVRYILDTYGPAKPDPVEEVETYHQCKLSHPQDCKGCTWDESKFGKPIQPERVQ